MNASLVEQVDAWFVAEGHLEQNWPDFSPREVQQTLAAAVAVAIDTRSSLVAEAGTGTGKTLAYLIPALISGRRTLLSTGSRTLQAQLAEQVFPWLHQRMGLNPSTVVLKGRANYLCWYRMRAAYGRQSDIRSPLAQRLAQVAAWAERTSSGDLSELGDPGDGDPFWQRISSTADNCLGSDCPDFTQCHVVKARRAAQSADIIVVNHHLLLADFSLREEGFGEILPGVDSLILDEAHHLADIAGNFFGRRLSHRQMTELIADLRDESQGTAATFIATADFPELLAQVSTLLAQILGKMAGPTARFDRLAVLEQPVAEWLQHLETAWSTLSETMDALKDQSPEADQLSRRLRQIGDVLSQWLAGTVDHIAWAERTQQGYALCLTPHEVSSRLSALWQGERSVVLTSATLAVGDNFTHFTDRVGLNPSQTLRLDSPFNYPQNARLYLPPTMPDPNTPGYTRAVLEASLPLLKASQGGAFLLCTSLRAVKEAAQWLRERVEYPLYVQGDTARGELLQRFREDGHAILIGTQSFWEGVDVRGHALRLVVIDRLPFTTPDDPVQKARDERLRHEGRTPFTEMHLPRAVLMLKQGAGRLIRDEADRGVLMIADPRMQSRSYGRLFLRSLPPMRRTPDVDEVCQFLAGMASQGADIA